MYIIDFCPFLSLRVNSISLRSSNFLSSYFLNTPKMPEINLQIVRFAETFLSITPNFFQFITTLHEAKLGDLLFNRGIQRY